MEGENRQQQEAHRGRSAQFANASFYQPLSTADPEIRLLTLAPSGDPAATISCTLSTVPLSTKPAYIALSYVWGEDSDRRSIIVNGQSVSVLASLAGALSTIRAWSSRVIVLWADNLCINQQDYGEKSHQVKLMSRIYAGARLVLGWLGESADDSDHAIDVINKMALEMRFNQGIEMQTLMQQSLEKIIDAYEAGLVVRPEEVEPTSQWGDERVNYLESADDDGIQKLNSPVPGSRESEVISRGNKTTTKLARWLQHMPELIEEGDCEDFDITNHVSRIIPNRSWRAINAFFERPFWKRLWIRQEIVLAQHLILLCGMKVITWDEISLVGYRFGASMNEEMQNNFHPSFRSQVIAMKWGDASKIQIWREFTVEMLRERGQLMPIFSMIPMTAGLEASNPRDHVYGILGISEFGILGLDVSIDDSRPVEDLYSEFSSHWIKFATECSYIFKLLEHPLCLAGIGYIHNFTALPSWALDLSVLLTAEMNRVGLDEHQAAGKSTLHMAMADTNGGILRLRGDVVATITDTWLFDTDTSTSIQDYVASATRALLVIHDVGPLSASSEVIHTIYRIFMVNPSRHTREKFHPGSTSYLENFACFIWCLLIKHIEEVEDCIIDDEGFKSMLNDIKDSGEFRIPSPESGIIDFTPYMELLSTVTAAKEMENFFNWMHTVVIRCFFSTKERFIGLGPRFQMK